MQGLIIVGIGATLVSFFLLFSLIGGEKGFPLDDAWIHQTYARNFALSGRWEYVRGQTSAGSTAPFWTMLLALGYFVRIPYRVWTLLLGVLSLIWTGWLAGRITGRIFPQPTWVAPVVSILCVSEWHLVWSATSGMETVLFSALGLAIVERSLYLGARKDSVPSDPSPIGAWVAFGFYSGLLFLTRPEGVLLIGLTGLWLVSSIFWGKRASRKELTGVLLAFACLLLLVLPYLYFNLRTSGGLFPNTFYAKQAEYAHLLDESLFLRLLRVALPPLTGFQILLLPGVVASVWESIMSFFPERRRMARREQSNISTSKLNPDTLQVTGPVPSPAALLLLYAFVHLLLYALRLPVTYQHGRYLIPIIPPLIITGVGGMALWVKFRHTTLIRRVLGRTWVGAVIISGLAFLWMGGQAYARDVHVIEREMVATAQWLSVHTEADAVIAAHDIGAIGYFSDRQILDLAGLVSPRVVPMMTDGQALASFVLQSPAGYLVTAPGWPYENLTQRSDVVLLYRANSPWTQAASLNSTTVYRLPER